MSRIVVDADGLIKLGKAGVLALLLGEHEVLVPGVVYEEAVKRGKRELYEDAFGLETALGSGSVEIFGLEALPDVEVSSLGPGELDVLRVYREEEADAVLSDDRAFLRFLETASVPYLTPASVVVGFVGSAPRYRRRARCPRQARAAHKGRSPPSGEARGPEHEGAKTEGRRRAMSSKPYPMRIPENLIALAEARAAEERTDRSTALRQLLYAGAEDYVLELLGDGRVSVSRAAELLNTSVHRVHGLTHERGVETGSTPEQQARAERLASRLF